MRGGRIFEREGLESAAWCTPAVLVLRRLRQEDYKFENSLGCIAGFCLKNKQTKPNNKTKPNKTTTLSPPPKLETEQTKQHGRRFLGH